jgi:hypothetical protein
MFGYTIEYRIKRLRVLWRKWQRTLDNTITPESSKIITPYQEKAMRLWKLSLRDRSTKLAFNTFGIRQIEKENLLLVFQYNPNSYSVMTIMNITEAGRNLYELSIPEKQSIAVCDYFDDEMDRRMSIVESTKRSIIETDLDRLVEQQDSLLKSRK